MIKPQHISNLNLKIGITHGDFNGIGYEIIIKTFLDNRILEMFTPVIYGSSKIASYYRKTFNYTDVNFNLVKKAEYANPKRVNIVNCTSDEVKIEIGKLTDVAGEMAVLALEKAVEDLKNGTIDALVTAPINKKNTHSERFNFAGHTDYFANAFNTDDHLMVMVNDDLRIGILTGHIPLKEVPGKITKELLIKKINVMNNSLKADFGIQKPKIAVLGLNPHASDEALIGTEESEIIIPAIEEANKNDILTFGPFPADGFFGSNNYKNFDGILAMYHDQGMLPFKSFAFGEGINFTAGLPIIRTSPAHGTAFDIAGKNIASPNSLRQAIYMAIDLHNNRNLLEEMSANPLPLKNKDGAKGQRSNNHAPPRSQQTNTQDNSSQEGIN
ncbi:MAG: 4-hydroxythreonine-4-phosphate dehydrogenase PdxA [Bacteroidales bacterium]